MHPISIHQSTSPFEGGSRLSGGSPSSSSGGSQSGRTCSPGRLTVAAGGLSHIFRQSLARMNKKDSWIFWWTLYLTAAAWIFLGIFSLIRFRADYLLVVGVCLSPSIANIVGFTIC